MNLDKKECMAAQMALTVMIEDLQKNFSNPFLLWNIDARQTSNDILKHAKSALRKLEKHSDIMTNLPKVDDNDISDMFTKPS